ncbi:MAG: type II secretion system protein GspG [bacterium]|nr:type II secretion system protein GspG [bacterium]
MKKTIIKTVIILLVITGILYTGRTIGIIPGFSDEAVEKKIKVSMLLKSIQQSIEQYNLQYGRYPTTEEGFAELIKEGYLLKQPVDPWGNQLKYYSPPVFNSKKRYDIISFGADGKSGGNGINTDISVWNF